MCTRSPPPWPSSRIASAAPHRRIAATEPDCRDSNLIRQGMHSWGSLGLAPIKLNCTAPLPPYADFAVDVLSPSSVPSASNLPRHRRRFDEDPNAALPLQDSSPSKFPPLQCLPDAAEQPPPPFADGCLRHGARVSCSSIGELEDLFSPSVSPSVMRK